MYNRVSIKKYYKAVICFVAIILTIVGWNGIKAVANASEQPNDTSEVTIEGEFLTDSVLVSLTVEETRRFKEYTIEDFKEIDCVEVVDLSPNSLNYVKNCILGGNNIESKPLEIDNFKRILSLKLKEGGKENVYKAIKLLSSREEIFSVAPNYIHTMASIPNDSYYTDNSMWGLENIQAEQAWEITTGSNTVTVGILDSGIQVDHPDLQNRVSTRSIHADCTTEPVTVLNKQAVYDAIGHGTNVAGIIGAQGNNELGGSGVCWNVEIVSLKVFSDTGETSMDCLVRAIDHAIEKDIRILNYSGAGPFDYPLLEDRLESYTGLFVCAAGNNEDTNGLNVDSFSLYPTCYSSEYSFSDRVISVGAITQLNQKESASNYGVNKVSIYAPGEGVLTTHLQSLCTGEIKTTLPEPLYACECEYKTGVGWVPNGIPHFENGYHLFSHTSAATPFVTGVAALILSQDPTMTASEIKELILNSAETITISTSDGNQTVKKLNAFNALNEMQFTTSEIDGTDDVAVTDISTNLTEITVPETIGGKTVTKIGDNAFYNKVNIEEVALPQTITEIGDYAFAGCSNLESISGLQNVETIGSSAFSGCGALSSVINLPNATEIGNAAFSNAGITSIYLPETETIGSFAFNSCDSLTEVTGLNSVETIGISTFNGCSALEEIELPASLIAIGFNAFTYCNEMNVTIAPNNPNFTAVGNVVYNKSMTKLLFAGKTGTHVTVPATVTEVDYDAFKGNPYLAWLYFESSPLIRGGAFAETGLDFVYFYGITVPTLELNALPDNDFLAYVPYNTQIAYRTALNPYTRSVVLMPITVTCYIDGFTMENINTYYGATITYLPEPQKLGLAFMGWYDNMTYAGEAYETGEIWMSRQDLTLWAKWVAIVPPTSSGGGGYTTLTWQQLQALVHKREEIKV